MTDMIQKWWIDSPPLLPKGHEIRVVRFDDIETVIKPGEKYDMAHVNDMWDISTKEREINSLAGQSVFHKLQSSKKFMKHGKVNGCFVFAFPTNPITILYWDKHPTITKVCYYGDDGKIKKHYHKDNIEEIFNGTETVEDLMTYLNEIGHKIIFPKKVECPNPMHFFKMFQHNEGDVVTFQGFGTNDVVSFSGSIWFAMPEGENEPVMSGHYLAAGLFDGKSGKPIQFRNKEEFRFMYRWQTYVYFGEEFKWTVEEEKQMFEATRMKTSTQEEYLHYKSNWK